MLVLGSRSPRRSDILRQAGIPFVVRPMEVDEFLGVSKQCESARAKAAAAAAGFTADDEIVLGADTTVAIQGEILGKPLDATDARRMLHMLSGRRHDVLTGICLRSAGRVIEDCSETSVWFAPLSAEEIEDYVASCEPMDKAGAYAIQGLASKFIQRIEGCYFNVMGLPVAMVYRYLREM